MAEFHMIPVQRTDGQKLLMQIRQKGSVLKKRKVKTWTNEEDQQLIELYNQHPKKWAYIANRMADRNENQCLHRYRRLLQLGTNRKIWSSQEDQTIKAYIKKVGKNWKKLSQMIGTKTGKQIRERFINKLDPKIRKDEWTDDEDRRIIELYTQIGSRWSQISKKLPGRPQNKIKNRFYSYIQKNYDVKYHPTSNEIAINPQILRQVDPNTYKADETLFVMPNSLQSKHQIKKSESVFPSLQDIELQEVGNNQNYPVFSKISLSYCSKIQDDSSRYPRYESLSQFGQTGNYSMNDVFNLYNH